MRKVEKILEYGVAMLDDGEVVNTLKSPGMAYDGGAFELLMNDIECAISDAEKGDWYIRGNMLRVVTVESSNPSRSSNGGEYYYYRVYETTGLGVVSYNDWSCDFASYDEYGDGNMIEYDCIVGLDGLRRMAQLADVTIAAKAWLNKEPGCMKKLKDAIRSLSD